MSFFGRNCNSNSQPEDKDKDKKMTGLLPVFGYNNSSRKGDIVFVHGLAGHSWSTWHLKSNKDAKDFNFWLYWLGEDLKKEGIDVGVWTFGYEAARFQFSGAAMSRFDLGSNLLEYLKVKNIGKRPLIFVTHSMGGLVVKEAIRTALDFDDKKAIIKLTKGIVFLSTPHTGSHLANLIDNIRFFTRPNINVGELKAHSSELRKLNQWYRQNVDNLTIETKVFYETQGLNGILVVDEDSANPGIKDVQPVAVQEDHNSIAKPKKTDLVFESVKAFVKELLNDSTSSMNIEASQIIKLLFSEELKEGDKGVYERISKLLTLIREKLKAIGMEGLLIRAQEEATEANIARLSQELEYQIDKDESFVNQLKELMKPLESVEQVRLVMASNLKVGGNFKAGNMKIEGPGSKEMLKDVDVKGDMELGDLEETG